MMASGTPGYVEPNIYGPPTSMERTLTLWQASVADEVQRLQQALWDIYGILGYDQDGQATPAGVVDLVGVVKQAATEFREDYDELLAAVG